jgi:protein SCO1/2
VSAVNPALRPVPGSPVGARFDLVDHHGERVDNATYRGHHVLVFFGFTHCAMVCPRALGKLSAALDDLGPAAEEFRALYVTVDPERDTPEVMKAFLERSYPRFTGLTGTAEEIDAAKGEFRVFARRTEDPDGLEPYVVPHSAITYVLDRSGAFRTHFTEALQADEVAARLTAVLEAEAR